MSIKREQIGFFDRKAEFSIVERALPHWTQAGTVCFVTWRLNDALPDEVANRLDKDVGEILIAHDLPTDSTWRDLVRKRSARLQATFYRKLFATRDKFLDAGHGSCLLAKPEFSTVVLENLLRFDEERYFLTDAVVMPNHVHMLVAFESEERMLNQCAAWKRFMARRINELAGREGRLWQVDQFDHLVRSEASFNWYRSYIAENPRVANLLEGNFKCFSKLLAQ